MRRALLVAILLVMTVTADSAISCVWTSGDASPPGPEPRAEVPVDRCQSSLEIAPPAGAWMTEC
jgi:hypothetical protein